VLPKLIFQNKHQMMAFAEWAQNNELSVNNLWFSGEAHIHLDGVFNKQNVQFWVSENPCVIHEKVHRAPRITVWAAVSSHGVLGPIFFGETVNVSAIYYFCASPSCYRFAVTDSLVHAGWSPPRMVNVILDFLHDTFDSHVISNRFLDRCARGQNWPPE
jgi:hypothetical protein